MKAANEQSQELKNWFVRALLERAVGLVDQLPESALLALGAGLGRAARLVMAEGRRTAEARAARCLPPGNPPPRRERIVRTTPGSILARCALLRRPAVRALGAVHVGWTRGGRSRITAERRGAIVVSAHLGPFEAIAAAVAELGHEPAVVVRESYDPRLNSLVDRHRLERGIQVIHRGASRSAFSIVRALRAGQPVGFLPDLGARVPSIELSFLGETIAFPVGPQLVALRTGAPPSSSERSEPTHGRAHGHELSLERLELQRDPFELTHRVAGALERAILRAPEEWLWMSPPIRRLPSENAGR